MARPLGGSHPLKETTLAVIANNPTWGEGRVRSFMEEVARTQAFDVGKLPDARTIGRWKQAASREELAPYLQVSWPESFEQGLLPMEAAPLFLRHLRETGRCSVRRVRWMWYLAQSADDIPFDLVETLATTLAALDASGRLATGDLRSVEYFIAFRAWEPESRDDYKSRLAVAQERWPEMREIHPTGAMPFATPGDDSEATWALARELAGETYAPALVQMFTAARAAGQQKGVDHGDHEAE